MKNFCKNCKHYGYARFSGGFCKCWISDTKNLYTGIREISVNDLKANCQGECPKYKRKWWKFWIKKEQS